MGHRMCIAALADAEPAMSSLLQYRFPAGNGHDPDFAGHAFGNLLIAALTDVSGDFEEAVRQSNRVLAVRGSVVPVAGRPITLHAELEDGSTLEGESHIEHARGIKRIWITPDDVRPSEEALKAIAGADVVVLGPGSLYTSLLPPLLVPGMREALAETRAARVFVCNVATQLGETEGYGVSRHLKALAAHGLAGLVDAVVVNNNTHARQLPNDPASPVAIDVEPSRARQPLIVTRDVVDENAHRHDSSKLTAAVLELYDERIVAPQPALASWPRPRLPISSLHCAPSSRQLNRHAAATRLRRALGTGSAAKGREPRTPFDRRLAVRLDDAASATFDWDRAAEHCRAAYLRGSFLANGSLSVTATGTHLELVVDADELEPMARRLAAIGLPAGARVRRGRGSADLEERGHGDRVPAPHRRVGRDARARVASRSSSADRPPEPRRQRREREPQARRYGRAAPDGKIDALERRGEATSSFRLPRDAGAAERRRAPEATFSELAANLDMSRSQVQRAFDLIGSAALHDVSDEHEPSQRWT